MILTPLYFLIIIRLISQDPNILTQESFLLFCPVRTHKDSPPAHTHNVICMYILGRVLFLIRQTTVKLPSRCVSTDTTLSVLHQLFSFARPQHLVFKIWHSPYGSCCFLFDSHLSNMQTDKCLEVNHGWRSHESVQVYVIVLCWLPPGTTMWWSAPVNPVSLRWH